MNITLTGVTGFIGRHLVERLRAADHQLTILSRRARPGTNPRYFAWDAMREEPPAESLAGADAVIHLAGEPVAQRWTAEAKQRIRSSRIDGTRHLVQALSTISRRPPTLISASAIGIYVSRADEMLTEESSPGSGFLSDVTADWEKQAILAQSLGVRVVLLRIGIVLGKDGGALGKMMTPFKLGVGGRLGSGKQWVSWIHVDDVVGLILFALEHPTLNGAINLTSPNPVTNAEFTRELAAALHRPAIFPVPKLALKLVFGELANEMFASARILPQRALDAGYRFAHPGLRDALEASVH